MPEQSPQIPTSGQSHSVKTRPSEELLMEVLSQCQAARVLSTSLGRAQFAAAAAERWPIAQVCCCFLDLYAAEQSRQLHAPGPANLSILCQPDFPDQEVDFAAFPLQASGDAELTRDVLQAGQQRLRIGGQMMAATDNADDSWLHNEMRKLFDKVSRQRFESGALYLATKTKPRKKIKDFSCQFAFRDQQRLIQALSRPGVFSHRRIDTGARALIETMTVRDGDHVLDLGCGSGVVSLAAAFRGRDVRVHAVDSNPRAVECTRRGAELNGLDNITVALGADARCDQPGTYDLVLANPPYFSHHRITEIFLRGAQRALKPGGIVHVVTKHTDWYEVTMPELFDDVCIQPVRSYFIVSGQQR
jgi:16S rRNA G1207 methylase RsmC